MKNFITLAFLSHVLLTLIVVSAILPSDAKPLVQNLFKRSVLDKRTDVEKCPCTLARSLFDSGVSEGPAKGLVIFAQDECGSTTITGLFSKGFEDTSKDYIFKIVDKCGDVIYDLTQGLCVELNNEGGTKFFSHKFDDINLNCNSDGILNRGSAKKIYKRQNTSGSLDLEMLKRSKQPQQTTTTTTTTT